MTDSFRDLPDPEGAGNDPENIDTQAWEKEYVDERSWEKIQEDEDGQLRPLDSAAEQREKRRLQFEIPSTRIRRGMIRYLFILLDLSRSASETDMRPSRMAVIVRLAELFIREFFDQNPLSQASIAILRDGTAQGLTPLSGSPDSHIASLKKAVECSGDASLQNGLELALDSLRDMPSYGHREVLLVFSSLSSCDPGDISATIRDCKAARLRCSLIGLAAEVHVCRTLCSETGGTYAVALNEGHLQELVMAHAPPPPSSQSEASQSSLSSMVRMGFPERSPQGSMEVCSCHLALKPGPLYVCPRCKAQVCDLPSVCPVCDLTLVSSPHLARSYHHLFPVPLFSDVTSSHAAGPPALCFGCQQPWALASALRLVCGLCGHQFCFHCDMYIHETLHNCPGCECFSGERRTAAT